MTPHMTRNDTRATVLILGATGRLGAAAALAFQSAGWRVLAQTRQAGAALPAGVQVLATSPEDTALLAHRATGAQLLVHAINPLYTAWERDALRLARAGMDLAQRLGARLLLPGNVYNHGPQMPALLSEDSPQAGLGDSTRAVPQGPNTRKGLIRVQMEAELAERARRGDLRSTVVRAGDFFGCGQGTWFDQAIVKSLRQGRLVYPGPLDRPHAWAYLPDLAQALVRVASEPEAQDHRRWHFAGHTLTGAELLAQIEVAAGRLGWTPARGWRHGGMPWGLIRLAGRVWPMGRELAEMAYLWERPHALDGRAMAQAFGPLPATPIDQALRQTLLALGFAQRQPLQPAAQH